MQNEITMVTTVRNTAFAVALMRESFLKHHEKIPWLVCDDNSTDGAQDYVKQHADGLLVNSSQLQFGRCLDLLSRKVTTPYILMVDSDVEFLNPVLPDLIAAMTPNFVCVGTTHTTGECDIAGYHLFGQKKIDHSFALFHTDRLRHILNHFSFETYVSFLRRQYYDGGAMVYRAAMLLGLEVVELPDIWAKAIHYGGISALFVEAVPEETKAIYRKRYETIKTRLDALRADQQSTAGLTWNGSAWAI